MDTRIVTIAIYNVDSGMAWDTDVEQVSESVFRMIENDPWDLRLNLQTEFMTRINNDGAHVIESIIKESPFITRRFTVSKEFVEHKFQAMGEEIMQVGGYWQIDFGGFLTINLPPDAPLDIDEKIRVGHLPSDET